MVMSFTRLQLEIVNIASCQKTNFKSPFKPCKKTSRFTPTLEVKKLLFFMSSKTQFLRYFFVYQEKQWFQKTDIFFDEFQKTVTIFETTS